AIDSPNDEFRGHDGTIILRRGPAVNPLFNAFFEASDQAGYSRTSDVNSYKQEGFGPFDRHIYNGKRLSASHAYLDPAKHRANLDIETLAFVTKINFEGKKATGVTYRRGKHYKTVTAVKIVLAGGAINTPQLLQLSGVGDKEHLESIGIDTVVDLPGVGDNLQDHLEAYIQHACPMPVTEQPSLNKFKIP